MGEEIKHSSFVAKDFTRFSRQLREETDLLAGWFADGSLSVSDAKGGLELEASLVDENRLPAPINGPYLEQLDNPRVVPELASFNFEINGEPQLLRGRLLRRFATDLGSVWLACERAASRLNARVCMIGILPTVTPEHLTLANMSPLKRYRALNEQVLRLRGGRPISLAIKGVDTLATEHGNVMLEAATTSLQMHIKVDPRDALRAYNACSIVAAPMVAVAANSPFFFGRDLWAETRIPLFEQAVYCGSGRRGRRATFGHGYVRQSLMDCFHDNVEQFSPILPVTQDAPPSELCHLRLHNGTIWRWNRPLIGFDRDKRPHIRIEHRVMPAGPTVLDSVANAALFFGLVDALAKSPVPPESILPFAVARRNFYRAARQGLDAELVWLDGKLHPATELLSNELVPLARAALDRLGVRGEDIALYTGVIEERVRRRQNGAAWQRAFVRRHEASMSELVAAYLERQSSGAPVHAWSIT